MTLEPDQIDMMGADELRAELRTLLKQVSVEQVLNFFEDRMLEASHAACCEILQGGYYPWQSGKEVFRDIVCDLIANNPNRRDRYRIRPTNHPKVCPDCDGSGTITRPHPKTGEPQQEQCATCCPLLT